MAWDILTDFGSAKITTGGTSSAAGTPTALPHALDTGKDSRLGMICGLNVACYVEGTVATKATDTIHVYLYHGDTEEDSGSTLLADLTPPEQKAYKPGDRIVLTLPNDQMDFLSAKVHVVNSGSTGTNGVQLHVVLERG